MKSNAILKLKTFSIGGWRDFRAEIWMIRLPSKGYIRSAPCWRSRNPETRSKQSDQWKCHYITREGCIGLGHQVLPRNSDDVKVKLWLQTAGDWQIWPIQVAELCINLWQHKQTANGVPSDGCKETVIPLPRSNQPDLSAPNDEKRW